MMDDKELVEVWRADYLKLMSEYEKENPHINDRGFIGYMLAKRSQPSVVLPNNAEINHLAIDTAGEYDWNTIEAKEKYMKAFTDGALMICDDIARNITAAGIKYTIGE